MRKCQIFSSCLRHFTAPTYNKRHLSAQVFQVTHPPFVRFKFSEKQIARTAQPVRATFSLHLGLPNFTTPHKRLSCPCGRRYRTWWSDSWLSRFSIGNIPAVRIVQKAAWTGRAVLNSAQKRHISFRAWDRTRILVFPARSPVSIQTELHRLQTIFSGN